MPTGPRDAIARVFVPGKQGTGFAVTRDLVATCLHVVANRQQSPVVPYGAIGIRFRGHKEMTAELVDFDAHTDWALLRCAVPEGVEPLVLRPATPGGALGRPWWTFGYPDLNNVDGSTARGEVRNLDGSYAGAPALELYSEELKATPVDGHSGSPCMEVDDQTGEPRVIGIIRATLKENGRSFGKVYAVAVDAVLSSKLLSAQQSAAQLARPRARGVQRGSAKVLATWEPREHATFIGRGDEVAALDAALAAEGARVAVVAVQGMPGVGKTYLVEEWCARNRSSLGPLCRWVMDPPRPAVASTGLVELAAQAGIDCDRTPVDEIPALLAARRALIHIDNVDSDGAAGALVELLALLPQVPAIVTGRLSSLGSAPDSGWKRVEVECLDMERSVELLRAELDADAPDDATLHDLAVSVGGLPLALHLAAGYLRGGYTVEAFLRRLRSSGFSLEHVDRADPLWRERSRGVLSLSFEISRELFLEAAADERASWDAALSAFGWTVASGVGRELGAAITGFTADGFAEFIRIAAALSLVRRVPRAERPDVAWSVHPLLAEYLRARIDRSEVHDRAGAWIAEQGDPRGRDRGERWSRLTRENASVHAWLETASPEALARVAPRCWEHATSHGPVSPWLDAVGPACGAATGDRSALAWAWAQLARRAGAHEPCLRAAALLIAEGDERTRAMGHGLRADILALRGDLDESLRIRNEEVLPVYERLGDIRERAVTFGRIADLLAARGDLVEALRIRREEALPVYDLLGDLRERAVTLGKIAAILAVRGSYDESLRILREDVEPAFKELGDVRSRAVMLSQIADVLEHRGDLDEALRIRRDDELPVFERLGDVRARAVTLGKIADILAARGEHEEALRILRDEVRPVFESLGDIRSRAVTLGKVAGILTARGDLAEALRVHREETLPVFRRLGDVRESALTLEKVAAIAASAGELGEAVRIQRDEVLPVYERLGGSLLTVGLGNLGVLLLRRGEGPDLAEARAVLERSQSLASAMGLPFPDWLAKRLATLPPT